MTPEEEAAAQIAEITPAKAPKTVSEAAINEKIRAGLTRDQAISTITAQEEWDEDQAAAAATDKKKK